MKFKLSRAALLDALGIVSIVPPRPLTASGQGGAGYLFVVRKDRCFIYSGGASSHDSRVDIAVESSEGVPEEGGRFIFPADKIGAIPYHRGELIEFESGHDEQDNRYWVRYRTELGAGAEWNTCNPALIIPFDDALESAADTEKTYSSVLLQEALGMAKSYLAKPTGVGTRAPEVFQVMQLFDASKPEWRPGDGVLFAADQIRACWVEAEDFKGKGLGLGIHGQHLPFVLAFLSKCDGEVRIRQGDHKTYAIGKHGDNGGLGILGWARTVEEHTKFAKWPEKLDTHILHAKKDLVVQALKSTRAALDKRQDKIRVVYKTSTDQTKRPGLMFLLSEGSGRAVSDLVDVDPIVVDGAGIKGASEDFAINVNVDHLLGLVEPLRGHEFGLRIAIIPKTEKRRETQFFRTIEEFWIDDTGKVVVPSPEAKQCRVTRFTPSKE